MNIFKNKILQFIVFVFISTSALGQPNTVIAYGNGIITDCKSATEDLKILMKKLHVRFSANEYSQIERYQACNENRGIMDLFEVASQVLQMSASGYYRFLGGIDIFPDSLQQSYIDGAAFIDGLALKNEDVQKQVDFYKESISKNKRVIIVPHSQGNFFATLAYNNLTSQEQEKSGIVSVANVGGFPADGRLLYTTSAADTVVDFLFLTALANGSTSALSLVPNVVNPFSSKEPTGHFFIQSYLKTGNPSKEKILDDIWSTFYNLPFPSEPEISSLVFSDHNLKQCVLDQAARFNWDNVEDVTHISCREQNISDVGGIEQLTALTGLDLYGNQITDIDPLSNLTALKSIELSWNQITDIDPLSNLIAPGFIGLSNNQIVDISPLSGLSTLEALGLDDNQITDISPLARLTALTYLNLTDNKISDLAPLTRLTKLTLLSLIRNQITDIAPLGNLTRLITLEIYENQITDISPLANLTRLDGYLSLRNNLIIDISPLVKLTTLTDLNLNNNQITDITPIAQLTALTYLHLDSNQITDITPLANLTRLTYLDLSSNQITNITSLSKMTALTSLSLHNNQITEITSLANLTRLTYLGLLSNQITDITTLFNLRNLETLALAGNSGISCESLDLLEATLSKLTNFFRPTICDDLSLL